MPPIRCTNTLVGMSDARQGYSFPIARRAWRFARKARANWLERHQHPFNFAIHMFGIPLAFAGLVCLFFLPWYWGIGMFVLGYLFQYVGHRVEGNDVGELIPIKRALGLPVVAVVPRPSGSPPAA
ncbi:MAG TPA: Mpo1-like protein [Fimbriiglobus sp.]|nr:Mpo1-like protein [Fimbriiglobus sp.]